jgi:hypothetical protein
MFLGATKHNKKYLIFEVLMAAKMSALVFWMVTLYGLVRRYQQFGDRHCPEDGGSTFF